MVCSRHTLPLGNMGGPGMEPARKASWRGWALKQSVGHPLGATCFICIISFHNYITWEIYDCPHFSDEETLPERFADLPSVTQLSGGE